jgi:AcrR family transcriptional regulator
MEFAAELFARQGYHTTSIADVVGGLGVGKGVFYWYFPSKEALFAEILRAAYTDLRRSQQAQIGDELDPVRRIELGIRASVMWFDTHRPTINLLHLAATDEHFASIVRECHEVAIADTTRHIKDAIADGQIADDDPELMAQALVGATERLARVYLLDRNEDPAFVADAAVAFNLRALGTGTAARRSLAELR